MQVSLAACRATLRKRVEYDEREGGKDYVDIVLGWQSSYESKDDLNDHPPCLVTSGTTEDL